LSCPSGVAVFGRDPDSSKQVWSSVEGYPGDFDYREFYRDIGHDLDLEYIAPYIHPDGIRVDTGIKYYRLTGPDRPKEVYVPEWAERKAERHAAHYLEGRVSQVRHLSKAMDRKPLIVAPYDAELFGHWWWEGPSWLDHLIRKASSAQNTIKLITLSEYLGEYPDNQVAQPSSSSWGKKGFNDVWLNKENDWIYLHLHAAAETLESLAVQPGIDTRGLEQAARELMLAQASDWAFMIHSGAMTGYAASRTRTHLLRFRELVRQMEAGTLDPDFLEDLETRDNVFPQIAAAAEYRNQAPAAVPVAEKLTPPAPPPARLRIAMVCP